MKYTAKYTEDAAIEEAKAAAQDMVRNDGYYAMYGTYGTGLVRRSSSQGRWSDDVCIEQFGTIPAHSLSKVILPDEWFPQVERVSWTSTCGNVAAFSFEPPGPRLLGVGAVTLTMEGRRHGIPPQARGMQTFVPAEVLLYESERTDASPFACGLDECN